MDDKELRSWVGRTGEELLVLLEECPNVREVELVAGDFEGPPWKATGRLRTSDGEIWEVTVTRLR